jgi:carboxypeptidase family protein
MISPASILLILAQQLTPLVAHSTPDSITGSVRGQVVSGVDSSPLNGVLIGIAEDQSRSFATVTTTGGVFLLSGLPAGSHTLVARFIGYSEYRHPITIVGGDTLTLMIVMPVHCKYDSVRALHDIAHRRMHILLQGGIAPVAYSDLDAQHEKAFGFTYIEFGDMLVDPGECLAQYNRVVFRALNATFGVGWRDSVRH